MNEATEAVVPAPRAPAMPERSRALLEVARERVVLFDGGMGTQIFESGVRPEDWGVPHCPESLVRSHPDVIRAIHRRYYEAGADVVETDTFNANRVAIADFGLSDDVPDLNARAARLAREAADEAERRDGRRRFVSGSIGPGTKLATLGHAGFRELEASYHAQVLGLLDGGADVLQIETQQDPLVTKAAIHAARRAFEERGVRLPVIVQFTIEAQLNTLLVGSDVLAAYASVEPFEEVFAVGLNCATGPLLMAPHVRALCGATSRVVSCLPNAGIPENRGGKAWFPEQPASFAETLASFVRELGVGIVGGCCGTGPEHIAALAKLVAGAKPRARTPSWEPSVASLFQAVPLAQEPRPLIVGERLNTQGSRKFKELVGKEDWDGIVGMAREQMKDGAHVLDVQLAHVGRDEVHDAREVFSRLVKVTQAPLAIDTTEHDVLEAALELCPGRPIVNSINLEAGEEKLARKVRLARRFGAACVALLIDEKGQATTFDWKLDCARRIHAIALREGLRAEDLIFDALTFPITTGQEEVRRAGLETLRAIRAIKRELPGVKTILGVSNVSFGIDPESRHALNSVFLHYAIEHGLDAAIVHPSKIVPLFKVEPEVRETCRRLVFDEREKSDPLQYLLELAKAKGGEKAKKVSRQRTETVEEALARRIVEGDRPGLEKDLERALERHRPLEIVNDILLEGMRVVGELFGKGEMQLPFVLQSAEVMKAAVKLLEPKMERSAATAKGTVVLATVRGDVHDIGKNLVDIILSNNGFSTRNLGIKIELDAMLAAAKEAGACAIGMSGLLVKSTVVMKENLEELNRRGLAPDVILGGAALNRRFVEEELRRIYKGRVFYAKDAFEGLGIVDALAAGKPLPGASSKEPGSKPACGLPLRPRTEEEGGAPLPEPAVLSRPVEKVEPPHPPFYGARVARSPLPLRELFSWINKLALFRGQWGFSGKGKTRDERHAEEREKAEPLFERACDEAIASGALEPAVAWGYFACRREGESLVVYEDAGGAKERLRFDLPRASRERGGRSIVDFFRDDVQDVLAVQLVTVGAKASERARALFEKDDYQRYLAFHGLSVEATEALAEHWHARIRRELKIDADDARERPAIFRMQYRGARYSFGYPACPRLEDQEKLLSLLPAAELGVTLTEGLELVPEQSTSALVCHHPRARYFAV